MYVKPMSWSQLWSFQNKPEEFYQTYILGIKFEQTREMLLGDIIHQGLEGKDWLKMLRENNFTSDYERSVGDIMKNKIPDFNEKEVWLGEKGKFYEETDCTIAARADGRDKENHILYEIKTGKNFWTQDRVDEHGQLTLYSFIHYKQFGKIPDLELISFNVNNGKMKIFKTKRTIEQLNEMCKQIREVVSILKNKGWWEKRV